MVKASRVVPVLGYLLVLLIGLSQVSCVQDEGIRLSDGSLLAAEELRDQALIVNYWAEWCTPCREEIPVLNALHQEKGVTVLGVDFDRHTQAELDQVMERMQIRFPQLADSPETLWQAARPKGLPHTLLIVEGRIVRVLEGPQTRESLLGELASVTAQ